jgi:hypothetical protein
MSKSAHDLCAMVVNFLFNMWEDKHMITIGLMFEVSDISGAIMVPKLQLLDKSFLIHKILTCIKNDESNL